MANIALRAVFVLLLCSSLRCYARFTSRAAILLRISPPMHIVCFIRPNVSCTYSFLVDIRATFPKRHFHCGFHPPPSPPTSPIIFDGKIGRGRREKDSA